MKPEKGETMKYKVRKKQFNSRMCFVCGLENHSGLKTFFYEMENDSLVAIFKPSDIHQSYPGRLHGGVTNAILDETIGRAIMMKDENIWGVTVELNVKYKKPLPLDEELKVVARITKDTRRIFEGSGEILSRNNEVAAIGYGKYLKLPLEQITEVDHLLDEWKVAESDSDPAEIELLDQT